jgi:hypothetical protein
VSVAHAEGKGFRLGDSLVLHLGITTDIHYDSNVFYEANNPTGAAILRVVPRFDLATRPPQRGGSMPHKLDFRIGAALDYQEYLTNQAVVSTHRQFGVRAGMLLTVNPEHPFTFDLYDNYIRSSQPPYLAGVNYNIDRDTNEAGMRFRYRPGGGRLDLHLHYAFGIDIFEVQALKDLDVIYNKISLRAAWKFFPKTALWIEVTEMPYTYLHPGVLAHPDSYPLRALVGVTGLLTYKLNVNAWIGYGNGFYQWAGPNPNTPLGGLELRWKPTMLSTGALGYKHDFMNSLLGAFYDFDMVYISWAQDFWRIHGLVRLQYANNRYQGIGPNQAVPVPNPPFATRNDNNIMLLVDFDLKIKDWAAVGVYYELFYNNSDTPLNLGALGLVPADYTKHTVGIRLVLAY